MESANWTRSQRNADRVCRCLIPKTSSRLVPPLEQEATSVLFSSAWAIGSRSNPPYELLSNAHLAIDSRNLYAKRECCVSSFINSIRTRNVTLSVPVYQPRCAGRSPQLPRPRSPLNSSAGEELRPE